MRANIAKLARTRETATGGGMMMVANDLAGYPAVVSQGASPNTMTFGDWSQLCLLEYSMLEISTDPFGVNSTLFKSGMVGIRCLWSVDALVLNPSSFVVSGALS